VDVDQTITCIDCGEPCHLLSYPPEDGHWQPGDVVVYRCTGCGDRWDLVVSNEDGSIPDDDPADDAEPLQG
jgi:hypothetical protein